MAQTVQAVGSGVDRSAAAAWLKQTVNFDPDAVSANGAQRADDTTDDSDDTTAAAPPPPTGATADTPTSAGDPEKVGVVPVIPVIIVAAKTLTGELTAKVTINNQTGSTLTLDTSSIALESGEYQSGQTPKAVLKANGDNTVFTAESKFADVPVVGKVSIGEVEGTIRYFVGDRNTVLSCHFHNPRFIKDPLGTNSADATISGQNAGAFQQPIAVPTHGSDGTFTFTLVGGGQGPSPNPQPQPQGNVTASCRVSVINQTQQTVFLRKQDKVAGDYVTNPANSLAPGASTQFVFAETANSSDHGCRGTMSWDIGDPKQGAWSMMWDNQLGAKNLSASFLDPDNGSFHSLDQIDNGDENVPVTFTLSGGGGAGPATKTTSCAIMVQNSTTAALKLSGSSANSGAFQNQPPASIAAGASALVTFAGADKGAKGSMQWDVGDPKAATWSTSWDNPPGAKNSVAGTVDPDSAGFKSDQTTADGDDDVAMSFTISGGQGPNPNPNPKPDPQPGPAFQPPPGDKDPTLRKGDNSADGWVEYLQQLLQSHGFKSLQVDGDFGIGTYQAVLAFQKQFGIQADGVVGNQTWAALRGGVSAPPSTDGRDPHTFVDQGVKARWYLENEPGVLNMTSGEFILCCVSVGEGDLKGAKTTIRITPPGTDAKTVQIPLGDTEGRTPDDQGDIYFVRIPNFLKTFPAKKPGAQPEEYFIEAYFEQAQGGDFWKGNVTTF